jgi:hypothetical protein
MKKVYVRTDINEIDKDVSCLMNLVDQVNDRIDCEDRDKNYKPTFSIQETIGALSFALGNFNSTPEFTNFTFKDVESNKLLVEILILGAGIYLDGGSDMDRIMKSKKYNKIFDRYQNIVKYVKTNFLELVDLGQKMEELNLEIFGAS